MNMDTSKTKISVEKNKKNSKALGNSEFIRAENEDDDGYDPYSDRKPKQEPLFARDPWV